MIMRPAATTLIYRYQSWERKTQTSILIL